MDFFKFTQQNECMNQKKLYDEDCEGREKKKCTRQTTLKNVNPNNHL
jgi:hypothetical protein